MSEVFPDTVGQPPHRFRRLVSQAEIRAHVQRLGRELTRDYAGRQPILVGVLNGCFIFMADLIRELNIPCEVDFIKLSSYGDSMKSGTLSLIKDVDANLENRHVLLVEDIVDTGKSLEFLRRHLLAKRPASLAVVAMFLKEGHEALPQVEYAGMTIPDRFVVGYGLDFAQAWRQLPDLYVLVGD